MELRRATADDEELLFAVYSATRRDEVSAFGWSDEQAEAFLRMQFLARRQAYKMQFPAAAEWVIIADGTESGHLTTEVTDELTRLIDIAILPQFRRKGVATAALEKLKASGRPIVLHVDKVNTAALAFYSRQGFTTVAESQLMVEMTWRC